MVDAGGSLLENHPRVDTGRLSFSLHHLQPGFLSGEWRRGELQPNRRLVLSVLQAMGKGIVRWA